MRGVLTKALLLLGVTAMAVSAVSLNTMFVTRKAMKEPPSLEIILARIGDIYKSQEFTQKILFETPISPDSKWAATLGVLTQSAADSIIKELRVRGAYSDEMRAVLPLTVYVLFGEPVLDAAEKEGTYPNLMAAVAALTGSDMTSANESYIALKALEKEYLAMAGELAVRQNTYQTTLLPSDRDSILAQRKLLKAGKKKLKVQRKDLVAKLKTVLAGKPSVAADPALQAAVYNALSYAYRLNESAIDAAIAVGIQSVKVIPEIPEEIKTLGPRLIKDGVDGLKESFQSMGDLSGLNSEDFSKALLSQIRIGDGGMQIDMGGFGALIESDDKLGALKGLAPDILSQLLDKAKGDALAPIMDLVGNAVKAPERISKSIDLVQYNIGLLGSLNQKSVTGGKRLGKSIIDLPIPNIKLDDKKFKKADSAMQAEANALNEKAMKLSPRNLEMSVANITMGYIGLPGSNIYTTNYNGVYGFGDTAQYGEDNDELSAPGRGFGVNMLVCLTEKSDFIRSAMFYNFNYIIGSSGSTSPDGMVDIGGGDMNMNYTFLKDPFFFLPHVIGSGPAAIEWFVGGGVGLDFNFGFRTLSRTDKKWDDVYGTDSSSYRGDIMDFRFVWNNAVSAGGFFRMFDGALSVSGQYSKYFPQASLLNLGISVVDNPEKDTAYNEDWKLKDYKYEFDSDHAGQNLFGLGNYIASGFYEGGYAYSISARASIPVNVKGITNWMIRQGDKAAALPNGKPVEPWRRMFRTYLGISLNYTLSKHTYSIKAGRDKFGLTNPNNPGHLVDDNDDGFFEYDVGQQSFSVMLDLSINPDYIAIGAR